MGNSLEWMTKIWDTLHDWSIQDYIFPWASENYGQWLDPSSKWSNISDTCRSAYFGFIEPELSAVTVARAARTFEVQYESEKNLKPFAWDKIIYKPSKDLLYITGKIDLANPDLHQSISDSTLTIWHEPFNAHYDSSRTISEAAWKAVCPQRTLIQKETTYVRQNSARPRLAGLHIRRGDYKKWRGGECFMPDEFWADTANILIKLGYHVWVFSNEDCSFLFDLVTPKAPPFLTLSGGTFEQDAVRLMEMDLILGPPSTFPRISVDIAFEVMKKPIVYKHVQNLQQVELVIKSLSLGL